MTESLWPQLRLKADSEEELVELYRQVYLDTYVFDSTGQRRQQPGWCGGMYQFSERAFEHAFTESNNYRTSSGVHHKWSMKRLRRILWIREVLSGSGGTVERFAQSRKTDRSSRNAKRRTLVVLEEQYVVVFDDPRKPGGCYQFVTAFPADAAYLRKLRQESMKVETRRFSSPQK